MSIEGDDGRCRHPFQYMTRPSFGQGKASRFHVLVIIVVVSSLADQSKRYDCDCEQISRQDNGQTTDNTTSIYSPCSVVGG